MKKLLSILKKFFLGLFIVLTLLIIGHWVTGYGYILRGVWHTYLSGSTGPGIDESDIFYNRKVEANDPAPWPNHEMIGKPMLTDKATAQLEEIETVSFLVFKDGKMLFEQYWPYFNKDHKTNSFSAVKSFVGVLIGIAIEEGKIESLDQPVGDFLEDFKEGDKSKITIRDVITMSSGLDWVESGGNPYSDNAEAYYGWDLRGQIEGLNVEEEPGKVFKYKSGNTQILGFILKAATGKDVATYMSEKLWTPLQAESDALWNLDDENGDEKAFCCFYSTPRDFARVGQLYLQNGKWGDQQIVSESFIKECTSPADLLEEDGSQNKRYGLHWWVAEYENQPFYYCRGILGQYIIVLPHENMVIVRTGWKRKDVAKDGHPADLWTHIEAALELI